MYLVITSRHTSLDLGLELNGIYNNIELGVIQSGRYRTDPTSLIIIITQFSLNSVHGRHNEV